MNTRTLSLIYWVLMLRWIWGDASSEVSTNIDIKNNEKINENIINSSIFINIVKLIKWNKNHKKKKNYENKSIKMYINWINFLFHFIDSFFDENQWNRFNQHSIFCSLLDITTIVIKKWFVKTYWTHEWFNLNKNDQRKDIRCLIK